MRNEPVKPTDTAPRKVRKPTAEERAIPSGAPPLEAYNPPTDPWL